MPGLFSKIRYWLLSPVLQTLRQTSQIYSRTRRTSIEINSQNELIGLLYDRKVVSELKAFQEHQYKNSVLLGFIYFNFPASEHSWPEPCINKQRRIYAKLARL